LKFIYKYVYWFLLFFGYLLWFIYISVRVKLDWFLKVVLGGRAPGKKKFGITTIFSNKMILLFWGRVPGKKIIFIIRFFSTLYIIILSSGQMLVAACLLLLLPPAAAAAGMNILPKKKITVSVALFRADGRYGRKTLAQRGNISG
jgi:hypothetical protein